MISRGSSWLPRATPANAPMPAASISARPIVSTVEPADLGGELVRALGQRASASSRCPGAFWRSRAAFAAVAITAARPTASETSWCAESDELLEPAVLVGADLQAR